MVRTRFCWLLALVLMSAAVPLLRAQVIRVETREVPVDVTVTGKKGAPTGELAAKDFSVWEDGKPQKINSVVSAAADPETSLKHFVLYFDFSTMPVSDQADTERAATAFIDGVASPDRYMAVMSITPNGPRVLQDFTVASAPLKNAVAHVQNTVGGRGGSGATGDLPESLSAVCRSMAPATGRKALLLFTGGHADYTGAIPEAFKASVTACNRANVAMYVIAGNSGTSGGLQNAPMRPGSCTGCSVVIQPTAEDASANFAQMLAQGTGGEMLTLSNTLKDQLASVAREQDDYYRIFYTPPPAKDGSCHSLRVAVDTRGLTAKARNEYCTEKALDVVAGKVAGQALEANAAHAEDTGSNGATLQLPYFYTSANRASVHLSLNLIPAAMKLHGQIDLVGTVLRPDGGTAARFADTKTVEADGQTPWHYEQQFTVAAGTYVFQLAIGAGPDTLAKLEVPLKVEALNPASLGIGSIAFSTDSKPLDQAAPASIVPILEGHGPMTADRRQFVPAAENRFARNDQIYFYTEFYDPALGGANPPAVDASTLKMEYCISDRKTGDVKGCSPMVSLAGLVHPGDPVVPFATRLSALAQLPAGPYRLEVRAAVPSTPAQATRAIDFDLN